MKYRTKSGQSISDEGAISNLYKGVHQAAQRNFFASLLVGIFDFLVGIGAYITRCFLRTRIGERTFGFVSIALSIWLIWVIHFGTQNNFIGRAKHYLANPHIYGPIILKEDLAIPFLLSFEWDSIKKDNIQMFSSQNETSVLVILSIALILNSMLHYLEIYRRKRDKEEIINSQYKGDSLVFRWFEGKEIYGFRITKIEIWMVLEPLLILFLAMMLAILTNSSYPSTVAILMASSFCLFVEGYRVYKENRQLRLDVLDGRLEAMYVTQLQKEYDEMLLNAEPKQSFKEVKFAINQSITETKSSQIQHSKQNSMQKSCNYRIKVLSKVLILPLSF